MRPGRLNWPRRLTWLPAVCAVLLLFGCAPSVSGPGATAAAPTSANDNPTAGALRRATSQAQATRDSRATADRQAQATRDSQATADRLDAQHAAATATAQAQATDQAIVASASGWPARLQESFADDQRGWPLGPAQNQFLAVTTTLAGGRYDWLAAINRLSDQGTYTNRVPAAGQPFGDFSASVTLQFVQRSDDSQTAYGLVFRETDQSFGFFGLMPSGLFLIAHSHGSPASGPLEQSMFDTQPPADTHPGVANRLTVVAIGSEFVFLVNNRAVDQMSLNLPAGSVGLGVQALQSPDTSQADFSDLSVNAP
jgi:hypothetical protein